MDFLQCWTVPVWIAVAVGCSPSFREVVAELESTRHEIQALGYPVTLEELQSWYGVISLEDNAAPLYLDALKLLQSIDPSGKRLYALDELLKGSQRDLPYPDE
ncbi:MAG: hypothetical protein AMXMBFR84_48510 [Candidatus Hydrogenedentota bacterium]